MRSGGRHPSGREPGRSQELGRLGHEDFVGSVHDLQQLGVTSEFLDRVFLAYLERQPEEAPEMFRGMFEGVAPERMARFLFDGGTRADRIGVMRSLPATPLIGQALRSMGPALRDTTRRG